MSTNGIRVTDYGRFVITEFGRLTATQPVQSPQQLTYDIGDILSGTIDNPPNSGNSYSNPQAIVYATGSKYVWSPRLDYTDFYSPDRRLHINGINFNTQGKGYRIKLTGITSSYANVDTWTIGLMSGTQIAGDINYGNAAKGFGMIMIKVSGSFMQVRLTTNTQSVKSSVNTNINQYIGQGDTWELEIIRDVNDHLVATFIKNGTNSYSTNTLYTNMRNTNQNQTFTFADVGGFFINWYGKNLSVNNDIEAEMIEI